MGGWYDAYTTLPATYLEQGRNTILGGARESMLFCYCLLHAEQEGMDDIAALKGELHGQHKLACLIEGKKNIGVSVPKKPNCDAREELYIAGMYGMLTTGQPVRILSKWKELTLDMKMEGAPQQTPGDAPSGGSGSPGAPGTASTGASAPAQGNGTQGGNGSSNGSASGPQN